jgi:hypothetical protein
VPLDPSCYIRDSSKSEDWAIYYVIDEITVRPGKVQQLLDRLGQEYVPGAEERELRLVGCWSSPPVEPEGEAMQVLVLWSLEDSAAFWRQKHRAVADPKVEKFWQEAEGYVTHRERRYMTPASFSPLK